MSFKNVSCIISYIIMKESSAPFLSSPMLQWNPSSCLSIIHLHSESHLIWFLITISVIYSYFEFLSLFLLQLPRSHWLLNELKYTLLTTEKGKDINSLTLPHKSLIQSSLSFCTKFSKGLSICSTSFYFISFSLSLSLSWGGGVVSLNYLLTTLFLAFIFKILSLLLLLILYNL